MDAVSLRILRGMTVLATSSKALPVQNDFYCTGATRMSLTSEGLTRIAMPHPDEPSARRIGRIVAPIPSAIAGLQRRIENLRRTRDRLLPRILPGPIDVTAPCP